MSGAPNLPMQSDDLVNQLRTAQAKLQQEKIDVFQRRLPFGDLVTDRVRNAREYGFGEGTTCYDSVVVLGDVRVGRNVWIGPFVVLDGSGGLEIGDNVSISAGVQIYTHNTVDWATSMGEKEIRREASRIGSGVYIGPNTIVSMGVRIGDRAVIGAMSLVNGDVAEGAKVWGVPARASDGPS